MCVCFFFQEFWTICKLCIHMYMFYFMAGFFAVCLTSRGKSRHSAILNQHSCVCETSCCVLVPITATLVMSPQLVVNEQWPCNGGFIVLILYLGQLVRSTVKWHHFSHFRCWHSAILFICGYMDRTGRESAISPSVFAGSDLGKPTENISVKRY